MQDAHPRSGRSAKVVAAAVVVGLIGSGALVWQASSAAFTASTDNANNSWTSGSVTLTDNDFGGANFNETNLKPGDTGTKCILVTYNGSVASSVTLYSNTPTGTLGQYLDLDVSVGSGSTCASPGTQTQIFGDVNTVPDNSSDTLDNFAAAHTDWGTGAGTWTPSTAGTAKPYTFTYTLGGGDAAQGLSATGVQFTWEAQSS
ncbi:hypothetical protein [Spirilliplanes yamanashiensis]|uniref:Uncharacterized protein n=1 Tax=Spirilliplanes yamanashiensis TaxID=42233 RepID=A0A8J4DKV5_9ACTN|nr:hypothetical protein [Spirilliplanes yamanashiensis]MDP9818867.1 hypothetical protein [Spirilliplanes yamanashiensis]GIJ05321.1 hypothetical protein Sya03_46730 [Spirilliplanes yamanashiensis]